MDVFRGEPGEWMDIVVFRLFLCPLPAKQNKTKGMKEIGKSSAITRREKPRYVKSGYSKELNVQNVSYLMQFPNCSEKRYSLICIENWYKLRFFK